MKHNEEVVDNLKHLHEAKVCRLGMLSSMPIGSGADTIITWDFEIYDIYECLV